MSKRNFILLIIILVIIVLVIFGIMYFRQPTNIITTEGINFGSIFNPFNTTNTSAPTTGQPPADISGYQPENTTETASGSKLKKISSMPVAGFVLFSKERLIEVPPPAEKPVGETAVTYNFGENTIKNGSPSETIKELQKFLNNTLGINLTVDGVYNNQTIEATKQWQTAHGLTADGLVGPKTKSLMYSSVGQLTKTTNPTPPLTEFVPALRYVDRATGNVFQTFLDKIQEKKFTTTVIPKIHEALFGNNGEAVILRYLKEDNKTIETFVGNLPKEILGGDTENSELKGAFLPENITDIVLSFDSKNVFYLFNSGESAVGISLNLSTNKKTQLFESPFTEWLSSWPSSKLITLTTKPSFEVPGYIYIKDLNNQKLNQVLGKINGLTTLTSPNGKLILYNNNELSLNLYSAEKKTTEPVGVKTLPEKCVWNKTNTTIFCAVPKVAESGQYPDRWYQGVESFSDQIWKIEVETGNATMLLDPSTASGGEEVDGIKLAIDDAENNLFFVNKKDSFLWVFNLK